MTGFDQISLYLPLSHCVSDYLELISDLTHMHLLRLSLFFSLSVLQRSLSPLSLPPLSFSISLSLFQFLQQKEAHKQQSSYRSIVLYSSLMSRGATGEMGNLGKWEIGSMRKVATQTTQKEIRSHISDLRSILRPIRANFCNIYIVHSLPSLSKNLN